MAGIAINRITNGNVYANGNSLLGKVEDIKMPKVKFKMAAHKALGMVGEAEFFSGIEKLEGEIKWNSFYQDVWLLTVNPFVPVSLMVRTNVEKYDSSGRVSQLAMVTFLTVTFKEVSLGEIKQNDNAEFPSSFSCTYFKQVMDGKELVEFDALANIYKINGVDQLALYRQNIGG